MNDRIYLAAPVRTPIGKFGGGLASLSAADLGTHAGEACLERAGLDPADIDQVILTTPDGERLNAWWLGTRNTAKTVLYFQENGTNVSHKIPRWNTFRKMGVNGLMIDYRGYGNSEGKLSEDGIYREDYNFAIGASTEPGSTFRVRPVTVRWKSPWSTTKDTLKISSPM